MKQSKPKTRKLDDFLNEELKNPLTAAEYLDEAFTYQGPDRVSHLLQAMQDVAKARGIQKVSKASGVSRRTIYDAFSKDGDPQLSTVMPILESLGVEIRVRASSRQARSGRGKPRKASSR